MLDLRPIGYVIGWIVAALGVTMLIPMVMDLYDGSAHWSVFFESALITTLSGGFLALSCSERGTGKLSIQQTFLLAVLIWIALPIFSAIPMMLGATDASLTDAFFEAVSGMTTTGSTVFTKLEDLPRGMLLWRSMLQWFGGVGIIVVAMVFLPELRVGGMQIFKSEAFETSGKILPRAAEIAKQISGIYIALTLACFLAYQAVGMSTFQALNHALTTCSTGGFSTSDASFGAYQGAPEYVASIFMVLASLPFVRFVQLVNGSSRPLLRDTQVHAFLMVIAVLVVFLMAYRVLVNGDHAEHSLREGLFNATSILTGTGFASTDYQLWGPAPGTVIFFAGLVGGCAGSTCCSVKIFRFQILFASIGTQIKKIHSANAIAVPRFEGRTVTEDVLYSVMAFFVAFVASLGVISVLLAMTGLDFVTSISGAATALANVGPGLGDIIGPAGSFEQINDPAKWILTFAMLLGRLEVVTVFALFTTKFWRS